MKIVSLLIAAFLFAAPFKYSFAMTDSEALNLIATIDRNEIQASDMAVNKASDSKVLEYAKMLNDMHSKNLIDTERLAVKAALALPETPAVNDLTNRGAQDLAALQPLTGKQFETAYITAMIQGHTDALDIIDHQLVNGVENEDVKEHIAHMRKEVDKHLQKAKEIQKDM